MSIDDHNADLPELRGHMLTLYFFDVEGVYPGRHAFHSRVINFAFLVPDTLRFVNATRVWIHILPTDKYYLAVSGFPVKLNSEYSKSIEPNEQ